MHRGTCGRTGEEGAMLWSGSRFGGVRVVLVGALLSLLAIATAEAQTGRVVGRVTDAAGNPVPDARVTLVPADGALPQQVATTGETGGFEFSGVPAGPYTVRASRAGFRDRELRVELRPGELETVIARLRE